MFGASFSRSTKLLTSRRDQRFGSNGTKSSKLSINSLEHSQKTSTEVSLQLFSFILDLKHQFLLADQLRKCQLPSEQTELIVIKLEEFFFEYLYPAGIQIAPPLSHEHRPEHLLESLSSELPAAASSAASSSAASSPPLSPCKKTPSKLAKKESEQQPPPPPPSPRKKTPSKLAKIANEQQPQLRKSARIRASSASRN